jgi:RNA polymerase sigma-70 factor (ECF subfamily)
MSLQNRPRLALSVTDAAKLERIWNEYAASVLGMLKAFCTCPEDAQDALQELFLRVGTNPSVVESAKSPRAFLIVSARRIAIDAARKRASDQRREESPEATEAVHPSPMAPKNDDDLALAISKALAELPPEQRFVFEAKVLHGKTLAVIATEQSITLNTAASRLRYSLDKIRGRLRPHYEAMKNQTTKSHPLSDSSARLIKPLEPKRVPSVVPGLEGVAAFAVADGHIESIDIDEPILFVCPAPVEILAPEPLDYAVHVDPVFPEPETCELPSEPVDHTPDDHVDPMVTQEVEPTDAEVHVDPTDDASSSASGEDSSQTPDDASDGSTELLTAIFESNFSNEEGAEDDSDESGINFIDLNESQDPVSQDENPVLGDFFTIEIQPEHSGGESTESSDVVGIPEFSEHDYNEYLLREYKSFLADNPDWIEAHVGGDIQAQVITTSEYTSIELENPGAARCFDQWYYETYIEPYENSTADFQPVQGGSLNLAGNNYDFGTLLTTDRAGGAGIPEAWMRGGTLELSGGQLIASNTVAMPGQIGGGVPTLGLSGGPLLSVNGAGVVHTENLNTGHDLSVPALGETSQTIVTSGRVVAADPIAGSFTVENGGSVSIGDQVFGEGTYNFNAETAMDAESQSVSAVASAVDAVSATVKPEHTAEAHEPAPIGFSVVPIVSGSDSPISTEEVHGMHAGHAATPLANLHTPSPASVELPVLIHSQEIQHLDAGSDYETGITFVDDDTYVAPASPDMNAVPVGVPANATHDVAAAVGGAFVAGSATQVAPAAKGLSPRKSLIA